MCSLLINIAIMMIAEPLENSLFLGFLIGYGDQRNQQGDISLPAILDKIVKFPQLKAELHCTLWDISSMSVRNFASRFMPRESPGI